MSFRNIKLKRNYQNKNCFVDFAKIVYQNFLLKLENWSFNICTAGQAERGFRIINVLRQFDLKPRLERCYACT